MSQTSDYKLHRYVMECPQCAEAHAVEDENDRSAAYAVMATHPRCTSCGILYGKAHYESKRVDMKGRCKSCKKYDNPVGTVTW